MGNLPLHHVSRLKKQLRTGRDNREKCLTEMVSCDGTGHRPAKSLHSFNGRRSSQMLEANSKFRESQRNGRKDW